MIILALETAADPGSVAVGFDGEIVERRCPEGVANSQSLLPQADCLLRERGLGLRDLDAVAFGLGPGSFTGLRVACGVAQGLAVGRDLPLLGVGTLAAMAEQCGAPRVLAALDARMGEVYFAAFERGALLGEVVVRAPEAVALPAGGAWHACGNGFAHYPRLRERFAGLVDVWRPEIGPSAGAVLRLAAPRLAAGERIDPAAAAPLYVRDKVARTVAERLCAGGRA